MSENDCPPIGFTLRVPAQWYEFDVWRASRSRELSRLIDARIAQLPVLAARRASVLRRLRQVAVDAERKGAVYCAAMAEPVAGGGHLLASCMVLQTRGPAQPHGRSVEAIAAGITATAAGNGSTWREVHLLNLAAGRAVRVREVAEVTTGPGTVTECVAMHTLLANPRGEGVLDVVLTSPQVQLAEPMLDVFAAISDTFAWLSLPSEVRS